MNMDSNWSSSEDLHVSVKANVSGVWGKTVSLEFMEGESIENLW